MDSFIQTRVDITVNGIYFTFLTRMKFPSAIQPATSQTVVGVIIPFRVAGAMLLVLVRLLAESFFQLHPDYLGKVLTLRFPFLGVGLTCTPVTLDWSTGLVKTMAVTHVVTLVRSAMLFT